MAAPIGNRFALGNENSGRPLKYKTAQEFQQEAEKYLETTRQQNGAYKPTLTGLCFHLGFESLQSFYDYEKREEFSYTIRRLRLFVQSCYEQQLFGFAWAGSAFALKNLAPSDWRDEITQNQNTTVTNVVIEEKTRDDK
jgi:hypothetical protein